MNKIHLKIRKRKKTNKIKSIFKINGLNMFNCLHMYMRNNKTYLTNRVQLFQVQYTLDWQPTIDNVYTYG